jgi:hypothetical protein
MGKYLHRFTTLESFNEIYDDSATTIITAFTCSAGTFVYDRCDETGAMPEYIWKNGNTELITNYRDVAVGNNCGWSSGAYDPVEDTCIEITAISTVEHDAAYKAPWVSYTTYEKDSELSGDWWYYSNSGGNDQNYGPCTLKYKGEVDWKANEC